MPTKYVEPSALTDVDKKQRARLQQLIHERTFMGVAVSIKALLKTGMSLTTIQSCVSAWNEKEEREITKAINDEITGILQENGMESLRTTDPFGNTKDCGWYESKAVSFSKDRMREALLRRKMDPDDIAEVIAEATVETPYMALAIRSVKEGAGEESENANANLRKASKQATAATRRK